MIYIPIHTWSIASYRPSIEVKGIICAKRHTLPLSAEVGLVLLVVVAVGRAETLTVCQLSIYCFVVFIKAKQTTYFNLTSIVNMQCMLWCMTIEIHLFGHGRPTQNASEIAFIRVGIVWKNLMTSLFNNNLIKELQCHRLSIIIEIGYYCAYAPFYIPSGQPFTKRV